MSSPSSVLRYVWPLPWSALGLLAGVLALGLGGRIGWRDGVIEAHGGLLARGLRRLAGTGCFEAITLGHVILALDAAAMDAARAHEHIHVRQYERWGALFVPAYLAASAWQWLAGRRAYHDNPFERAAYACAAVCHPGRASTLPREVE